MVEQCLSLKVSRISWILIVIVCVYPAVSIRPKEDDLVTISKIQQFPQGASETVYAGYLNITQQDKAFFYMYYESKSSTNDPVILWLNGGPGCSSMIGMVSENSPFIFEPQSNKMTHNQYAWNKNAHLVYLQSPAGVGFSKGRQPSLVANDTSVAQDNYIAVLKFFERFPHLSANDFYIAGESYAGIYIPRLAQEIISNNQQQSGQDRKINLKGILIGNGCTHPIQCYSSLYLSRFQMQFFYSRGFIDSSTYSQYISTCINSGNEKSTNCNNFTYKVMMDFFNSKANIYNVYGVCYPVPTKSQFFDNYLENMRKKQEQGVGNLKHSLRCSDMVGPNSLFNREQNRKQLHVQSNSTLKWTPCSDTITYTQQSRAAYSFIPNLVKYGLKIHYFSGDFDAMVPIQGTLYWLNKYRSDYGASIKKSWRPWSFDNKGVSGMIWQLDGITFWSVAGAGHMVPSDKPAEAKYILDVFLGLTNLNTFENPQSKKVHSQ